jgi:hypothetical protein
LTKNYGAMTLLFQKDDIDTLNCWWLMTLPVLISAIAAICHSRDDDIYLNGYANMGELMVGLTAYMRFYNTERVHQALRY